MLPLVRCVILLLSAYTAVATRASRTVKMLFFIFICASIVSSGKACLLYIFTGKNTELLLEALREVLGSVEAYPIGEFADADAGLPRVTPVAI